MEFCFGHCGRVEQAAVDRNSFKNTSIMSSATVKSSAKRTSEIFHTYLDELFRLFLKEYANTN